MNWKKWISIAAAVCLAVTAVPMRAVAQEELVQEKMLEEIKEEIKEELKEEQKEELKEEIKEIMDIAYVFAHCFIKHFRPLCIWLKEGERCDLKL